MTDINDKLIGALIKAQSEMTFASKTGTNPHFKSGYAPLETVIDAVKNPLNDNGIFYLQKVYLAEGGQCVETEFHGHGGVVKAGRVYVPADKQTPQGYGSALTYAKRYSLITACGLPSEDDDGNSAESNYKAKPKAKPKAEPKVEPKEEPKNVDDDKSEAWAVAKINAMLTIAKGLKDEDAIRSMYKANMEDITYIKEHYREQHDSLQKKIVDIVKQLDKKEES